MWLVKFELGRSFCFSGFGTRLKPRLQILTIGAPAKNNEVVGLGSEVIITLERLNDWFKQIIWQLNRLLAHPADGVMMGAAVSSQGIVGGGGAHV